MLHFGGKAPFSFGKFIKTCKNLVSERDSSALRAIPQINKYADDEAGYAILKKWRDFDTTLRNELVKIRSSRKKVDPAKYLRESGYADPSVTHIAISAHRNPSVLEAEKILDQERWRHLDELASGHYFDIDFLIIYGFKLLILEKWERILTVDKSRTLEDALRKS